MDCSNRMIKINKVNHDVLHIHAKKSYMNDYWGIIMIVLQICIHIKLAKYNLIKHSHVILKCFMQARI